MAHALSTGHENLERDSVRLQLASEDLEEGPAKDRVCEAFKDMFHTAIRLLGLIYVC